MQLAHTCRYRSPGGHDAGVLAADLDCRVCQNGDMRCMVRSTAGRCFVECAECMTGYWNAGDLSVSDTFRTEDQTWTSVSANVDDVTAAGWAPLILGSPA